MTTEEFWIRNVFFRGCKKRKLTVNVNNDMGTVSDERESDCEVSVGNKDSEGLPGVKNPQNTMDAFVQILSDDLKLWSEFFFFKK